jgi:sulfatase modifying factor 1
MTSRSSRKCAVACGLALIGALAGCGSKPAPPAPEPAPPAPAPAAPANPSPPAPAPQPASPAASNPAPAASLADGESVNDAFVLAGNPDEVATRYVVDPEAGTRNADLYAVYDGGPVRGKNPDSTVFLAANVVSKSSSANADAIRTRLYGGPVKSTAEGSAQGLPPGFIAVAEAGFTEAGLPLRIRCERSASDMVLIPEGAGTQGIDASDLKDAGPPHAVFLDAFYIDAHEVTVGRWEAYRDARKSEGKKGKVPPESARKQALPDEPVTGVSWSDASNFAEYYGLTLPTEAQWERAARGVDGFVHPWGNGLAVWERPRVPGRIEAVGSYRGDVSPYGVFDLAGNAREWCADWFAPDYYSTIAKSGTPLTRNPTGGRNAAGNARVVKGGDVSWRLAARSGVVQTERPVDVGFRCVLASKRSKDTKPAVGEDGKPEGDAADKKTPAKKKGPAAGL